MKSLSTRRMDIPKGREHGPVESRWLRGGTRKGTSFTPLSASVEAAGATVRCSSGDRLENVVVQAIPGVQQAAGLLRDLHLGADVRDPLRS